MLEQEHVFEFFTEDRFTKAREDCPHPRLWRSADSDSTELEVSQLVGSFIRALKPRLVIETGSAYGQTSVEICKALIENNHGRLITLEPNKHRADITESHCHELDHEIHYDSERDQSVSVVSILRQSSMTYTPPSDVDFVWFDSLLELRVAEFRRYLPYLSKRAVVGFHDTGPQHPLRTWMRPLIKEGLLVNPMFLPTPRGVCFSRVKGGV